jgi:hypothetical protein
MNNNINESEIGNDVMSSKIYIVDNNINNAEMNNNMIGNENNE